MPSDDVNTEALIGASEPLEAGANAQAAPGAHDALRAQVRGIMQAEAVTQATIAREANVNPVTLSAWMNNTYAGRREPTARALTNWIEARAKREATRAAIPAAPGFLPTKVSADVWRLMETAQHLPDICVFAGDAGIGKTSAIRAYAERNPNVAVVTCQQSMSTITSLLNGISEALGIRVQSTVGLVIGRAIMTKLRNSSGLIVMDEAQYLSSQQLDELRSIHDLAGVGIMLAGNTQVYTRFEGSQRTAEYAQLFSRVGARMTRSKPAAADVAALLDAWGVEGDKERRVLRVIANKPGTLRGMTKCLRLAHMMASGQDGGAPAGGVKHEHILMAWAQIGGQDIDTGAA